MPPNYVISHLAAGAACLYAVSKIPKRTAWTRCIAIVTLLIVGLGMAVERRSDWEWSAMSWSIVDLVFLTNVTLEGSAVLFALLWKDASDRRARVQVILLGAPLLAVVLWTYAWYFIPPPDVRGHIDGRGICLQTSNDSCSAAAAVTLLYMNGISTDEREMARLCLTTAGQGTTPLGLFRGLAVAGRPYGLRPALVRDGIPDLFRRVKLPVIISVGLIPGAPPEVAARMEEYGWSLTVRHTVVVLGADADGKSLVVGDPTNGIERWPVADLKYLWDGNALALERR